MHRDNRITKEEAEWLHTLIESYRLVVGWCSQGVGGAKDETQDQLQSFDKIYAETCEDPAATAEMLQTCDSVYKKLLATLPAEQEPEATESPISECNFPF